MAACSRAHLSQPVREKDGRRANGPTREGGLPSPFVRNRWRCISFPPCFFLSSFLCKCFPDAKSAPGRAWPMLCKGETLFFHWFNTNTSRSNIFLYLHLSPDMFLLLFSLSHSVCIFYEGVLTSAEIHHTLEPWGQSLGVKCVTHLDSKWTLTSGKFLFCEVCVYSVLIYHLLTCCYNTILESRAGEKKRTRWQQV